MSNPRFSVANWPYLATWKRWRFRPAPGTTLMVGNPQVEVTLGDWVDDGAGGMKMSFPADRPIPAFTSGRSQRVSNWEILYNTGHEPPPGDSWAFMMLFRYRKGEP